MGIPEIFVLDVIEVFERACATNVRFARCEDELVERKLRVSRTRRHVSLASQIIETPLLVCLLLD